MNGEMRKGRRLLSLLLVFTLCLTLMPTAAFAEETLSDGGEPVSAYTVSITLPEEGVETAEGSGELTQSVSAESEITPIRIVSTYEDEPFDESYAEAFNARLFDGTGLTASCDEDGVITISGTPAADVAVNLADAFAEDEPVTVAETSNISVENVTVTVSSEVGTLNESLTVTLNITDGNTYTDGTAPTYKYTVTNRMTENGQTISGSVTAASDAKYTIGGLKYGDHIKVYVNGQTTQKAYFKVLNTSLENGSFEKISEAGESLTTGAHIAAWHTTASDRKIEVNIGEIYKNTLSPDGGYMAELNACEAASLYQEISTTTLGERLGWTMYHTARTSYGDETQRMAIVIGPTLDAGDSDPYKKSGKTEKDIFVTIAAQVMNENPVVGETYYTVYDGKQYQVTIASDTKKSANENVWTEYSGTYTVPSGQTETVFAFASIDVESDKAAGGNLIDGVGFGTGVAITEVEAAKNTSDTSKVDISIENSTKNGVYVVLDKDMKPVTEKNLTGGAYVTSGNGTFTLTNSTTTTAIEMPGLDKASGPYTVMRVLSGSLSVDSDGKANTSNLTDIATVNIVNFAGNGVTWSYNEDNSFESGDFDIVIVPHDDQTSAATKTYTATPKTGYAFATDNAITAEGSLSTTAAEGGTNGSKTVTVKIPAYGTTEKGTSGYNTVTLTGKTVLNTGVKLLTSTDGTEMAEGKKTYDGGAVARTEGTVDGATLSYTWQKKNENGTCSNIANNAAPSDAGDYNLKVTVTSSSGSSEVLGTENLPFTISPKELTVNVTVANKAYNGTTDATLNTATLGGVLEADESKVSLDSSSTVSASFENADVGDNKAVTLKGSYTLTGDAAKNYTLTQPTDLAANITKASHDNCTLDTEGKRGEANTFSVSSENIVGGGTVSNITVNDTAGIFDGTPTYNNGTLTYTLKSTAADNQTATVTLPVTSANYADYNIVVTVKVKSKETVTINIAAAEGGYAYNGGTQTPTVTVTDNKVTVGGLEVTYTGREGTTYDSSTTAPTNAGKYTMTVKVKDSNTQYAGSATCDFEIAKKTLTATITAENKTYDGSMTATVTPTLSGVVGNESVTATVSNAAFENKNVGENKKVTASISLTGAAAGNYTVNATAETTASITTQEVTISGVTVANSKTYDRDASAAPITTNAAIEGKVDTDSLTITVGTATYDNANVGTNKTVTFTGFALTGTDAGNYQLKAQPASVEAAITAKELTVSGVTIETTKVYDGNDSAKITNSGTLTGVLAGDTVTLKTGTATYDNAKVGTNKTVTFAGFALTGTDAGNYTVAQPTGLTADITAKPLTVTATASDKVYDGSTIATIANIELSGKVGDDTVSLDRTSMTAAFADADVGTNKAVKISGLSLTGKDAANYKLPETVTCIGTITTATGSGTVTLNGWTYGETANSPVATSTTNPGTVTYQYRAKNAAESDPWQDNAPTAAGEYTVKATFAANKNCTAATATADFAIARKPLTMTVTAQDKTYDGTTDATLQDATLEGVVAADNGKVTLETSGVTATFSDANVGESKDVSLSGAYKLTGDAAENYTLTQPSGLTANINKKVLTITPKDVSISRGTTPTFELDYVGLVGEESVTLADPTYTVKNSSGDAITMDDAIKTAGTYSVTVGGALTGDGAGNYEYVSGTGTLTVKRPSSGGGSTSVDSGKFDVPVSGDETEIKIEGEIIEKTVVVSEVTSKNIETVGEGENVVVKLEELDKNINSAKLTVGTLENVLASQAKGLEVRLPNAIVTIDKTTLKALTEQAIDDLQLVVEPDEAARKTLNSAQKESVSELVRPTIIEAFFTSFGNRIGDFKGGEVSVSVPFYTDKPIRAWYLKEDGSREKVGAAYDKVHATLTLTHFSHYAIEELENEDYDVAYASCPKDTTCPIEPFPDAVNKEWYHDGCHFCIDNGLMVGFPDGNFYPYGEVTRAQVVTILWRLEGSPATDYAINFADVPNEKWFTEAIRWATSNSIVTGYGDKTFGPNDAITREQFAAILYRYSQFKGYDVSVGEDTNILDYDDAQSISTYAVPAIQWACGSGMINGMTADTLVPSGVTSRAQAATMFMRYCAEIVK